jgi:hypothetical protein
MPQARRRSVDIASEHSCLTMCLTMREQIIIRISLRDDVPSRWSSRRNYSAAAGRGSNPRAVPAAARGGAEVGSAARSALILSYRASSGAGRGPGAGSARLDGRMNT